MMIAVVIVMSFTVMFNLFQLRMIVSLCEDMEDMKTALGLRQDV